jgi:hypothetical protein
MNVLINLLLNRSIHYRFWFGEQLIGFYTLINIRQWLTNFMLMYVIYILLQKPLTRLPYVNSSILSKLRNVSGNMKYFNTFVNTVAIIYQARPLELELINIICLESEVSNPSNWNIYVLLSSQISPVKLTSFILSLLLVRNPIITFHYSYKICKQYT